MASFAVHFTFKVPTSEISTAQYEFCVLFVTRKLMAEVSLGQVTGCGA